MFLEFVKYQSAGNDFIIIDGRLPVFPIENLDLIYKLCLRKVGIGADGLILLQHDFTTPVNNADFRMRIFNCDGTEAESCGNGLLCLGQFLQEIIPARTYRVRTGDRTVLIEFARGRPVVDMGEPSEMLAHLETEEGEVHFINTGVPHAVRFVSDVDAVDLACAGKLLRHHPLFAPEGANVNFAAVQSDGSIRARTFERGVEGETLSCGTGAVAIAAAAQKLSKTKLPVSLHFPGGVLDVLQTGKRLMLSGAVQKVFAGIVGDIV